ncbi:sterol carrier protein domain-containing protein [Micromonospora sp. STR1_7]|uniref:Sterol carrier protein domain-containing protein n=2 Tax=Micromonospora parastrephiae TaxID=2806101 RepID=A0ABS1XTA3_9ACTN|nr:sterol carrier protein domain-containing protein [Micromonospora parastrephiae]
MDIQALGSLYLGGMSAAVLAGAGRIRAAGVGAWSVALSVAAGAAALRGREARALGVRTAGSAPAAVSG